MKSFIIAEVGVNFNGNIATAQKMAKTAKECGADAVKFQTFWGLKGLELYEMTKEQWTELKNYCDTIKIEFMTTPHWGSPISEYYKDEDLDVIDFVNGLTKISKIASPYLINKKYVSIIAIQNKPILLSTGSIIHEDWMATIQEVERALKWIEDMRPKQYQWKPVYLLACTSKYPLKYFNWKRIEELKQFGLPVGISDHTTGTDLMPYPIIEKHFKLDDDCIDANVSLNPEEFSKMVKNIRKYENS